jgi:hypothetical protein
MGGLVLVGKTVDALLENCTYRYRFGTIFVEFLECRTVNFCIVPVPGISVVLGLEIKVS